MPRCMLSAQGDELGTAMIHLSAIGTVGAATMDSVDAGRVCEVLAELESLLVDADTRANQL